MKTSILCLLIVFFGNRSFGEVTSLLKTKPSNFSDTQKPNANYYNELLEQMQKSNATSTKPLIEQIRASANEIIKDEFHYKRMKIPVLTPDAEHVLNQKMHTLIEHINKAPLDDSLTLQARIALDKLVKNLKESHITKYGESKPFSAASIFAFANDSLEAAANLSLRERITIKAPHGPRGKIVYIFVQGDEITLSTKYEKLTLHQKIAVDGFFARYFNDNSLKAISNLKVNRGVVAAFKSIFKFNKAGGIVTPFNLIAFPVTGVGAYYLGKSMVGNSNPKETEPVEPRKTAAK